MEYFLQRLSLNSSKIKSIGSYEKVYSCTKCGEEYYDSSNARYCCKSPVDVLYQCNECNELHDNEPDAESCCEQIITCGVCLKDRKTTLDAVDCCMHTHPLMSKENRYKLSKMLLDGVSWLEAYQSITDDN